MQISICMMVKDEEKNIIRCLNSIKPILKNIDSELIIVDTGSADNTVEIAKEYTDKIYFHKWNNDFSGMRNKSISYAKGKWILIIDADEEITDCSNIIAFLKSLESKAFNTGLLDVKNMKNLHDESEYAMLKSPRLFRNDGYFHYEGIVHNSPVFKEPTINLKTTIVHYGYIEESVDILDKKFIRTGTLLKKALEEEPENIYYIFQLSVTYSSHKEYLKAYEIIKKAYNLLSEYKNKEKYKYVYYQVALCCLYLEYDEEAKKVCKEGLEIDNEYIDLVFYLAKAQGLTGKYEEALENYKRYMNLCDNYNDMKINFDVSLGMYTLGQRDEALQDIVKICFKLERFDGVFDFAIKLKKYKYIKSILELIMDATIKSQKTHYIKKFYEEKFIGDKLKEKDFFYVLEKYCDDNICKLFSNYDNDYSKLYLLRYQYSNKDSKFKNIIDEVSFKSDFNELEDYFGDVIYYKLKYLSSISGLLFNVWDKNINRYLNYISQKYSDFSNIVFEYVQHFKDNTDLNNLRINKMLCRYVLLIDKIDNAEYKSIFKHYIEIGVNWIKCTRSNNLISDEYINIFRTSEEKFLAYMSIAEKSKDNKKVYLRYLKSALKSYPYMKKGITILLESVKNEINKVDDEFEKYKVQVKSTIKHLIEAGNIQGAKNLILEYKELVSNDVEIYSIEAIILIMENKFNEAEMCLYKGLSIDKNNFSLLYNLACLYEIKEEKELQLEFYKKALNYCDDSEVEKIIANRIYDLKSSINFKIDKKIINNNKLVNEVINENKNNIIKGMQKLVIDKRNFKEAVDIFYYYLKHSELCIPEMHYFAAYAFCGLKEFQESRKYHNIAVRLEPALSNFVDQNNITFDYNFGDEDANCIGCGCNDFEIVNVSNQSVSESNKGIINPIRVWVRCKKCSLVYGNPLPSEESLNKYYSIIAKEKFGGIYGNIEEKEDFLFKMSNVRLDNISKITNKKTLLDIGTGIGFFVKCALDRGFDAYGLELTPEDCEYAKVHYGLDLMQRNFYSFTEDEQYDIVTMFEVIEHMRTPLKDLKRINKLVRLGGIFVIATPILDSEYAKQMNEKNAFWNVVTHLSYFTKGVLEKYLKSAGFELIAITDSMEGMGRMDFYCRKVYDQYE